jgi:hypothetical protein
MMMRSNDMKDGEWAGLPAFFSDGTKDIDVDEVADAKYPWIGSMFSSLFGRRRLLN